jgi:hypothetical protein
MRKAVFTTTRALFAAGAAGMLGVAMLAAPTAAWASSGGCTQSSPCTLAFTTDGQPAGTTVNTAISSSFNSPGAGPVKVQVLDASGQLVTNSKAAITVAITSTANPGGGTLSGTTTVSAVGGVASFSNLSINQPGLGYRLTATSRGMNPATSGHFDIWSSIQPCSTPPCSATASSATTSGTVTATSAAGRPQFVAAGIGGASSYSCAGTYQPVSDTFSFDVVSGSGGMGQDGQFTVTLQIDKTLVLAPGGHPGASTWQICYASTSSFPGSAGPTPIGDVNYFTGLLPDCSNTTPVAPCVQARNKDNAGDVIVTFLASGDPLGRG